MPEQATLKRARRDKRAGKAPTTQAGEFVREEIHHIREGKHGARSTKQAIAIGLSKARRAGVKLPRPPASAKASTKRSAAAADRAGRRKSRPSPRRSRAASRKLKREKQASRRGRRSRDTPNRSRDDVRRRRGVRRRGGRRARGRGRVDDSQIEVRRVPGCIREKSIQGPAGAEISAPSRRAEVPRSTSGPCSSSSADRYACDVQLDIAGATLNGDLSAAGRRSGPGCVCARKRKQPAQREESRRCRVAAACAAGHAAPRPAHRTRRDRGREDSRIPIRHSAAGEPVWLRRLTGRLRILPHRRWHAVCSAPARVRRLR